MLLIKVHCGRIDDMYVYCIYMVIYYLNWKKLFTVGGSELCDTTRYYVNENKMNFKVINQIRLRESNFSLYY